MNNQSQIQITEQRLLTNALATEPQNLGRQKVLQLQSAHETFFFMDTVVAEVIKFK